MLLLLCMQVLLCSIFLNLVFLVFNVGVVIFCFVLLLSCVMWLLSCCLIDVAILCCFMYCYVSLLCDCVVFLLL